MPRAKSWFLSRLIMLFNKEGNTFPKGNIHPRKACKKPGIALSLEVLIEKSRANPE